MTQTPLILHCGLPKTGTTSIQSMIQTNRAALLDRGLLLPGGDVFPRHDIAHLKFTRLMGIDAAPNPAQLDAMLDAIEAERAGAGARAIVLSNEVMSKIWHGDTREKLSAAMTALSARFDLRVVFYVRPLDGWLESMHNQLLRKGRTQSDLDTFAIDCERDLMGYSMRFDHTIGFYANHVGAQNLTIRSFDPARLVDGDVMPDFLDVLGIDPAGIDFPARKAESVSPAVCEMMLSYYAARAEGSPLRPQTAFFISDMLQKKAGLAPRPKRRLSSATRSYLAPLAAEIAAGLEALGFDCDPEWFFPAERPDPAGTGEASTPAAPEAATAEAGAIHAAHWVLIESLITQNRALGERVARLEAALRTERPDG